MRIYAREINGEKGAWFDVTAYERADDLASAIRAVFGDREWWIVDQDGWEGYVVPELPDPSELCAVRDLIVEYESCAVAALAIDVTRARELCEECHAGEFDSSAELAEQHLEDTGALREVPERLRYYIDYEAYGRDLELNGEIVEANGHWFWTR